MDGQQIELQTIGWNNMDRPFSFALEKELNIHSGKVLLMSACSLK